MDRRTMQTHIDHTSSFTCCSTRPQYMTEKKIAFENILSHIGFNLHGLQNIWILTSMCVCVRWASELGGCFGFQVQKYYVALLSQSVKHYFIASINLDCVSVYVWEKLCDYSFVLSVNVLFMFWNTNSCLTMKFTSWHYFSNEY